MLRYSLIVSLACYSAGMIVIGLSAWLGVAVISPPDFEWASLGTAFACVFLAGLISLTATGTIKRQINNDVVKVLFGTVVRTGLIGVAIVTVVVTQSKNFAFYMLCFSIIFYLGMVFLNTWLMLPVKRHGQETGSSRD